MKALVTLVLSLVMVLCLAVNSLHAQGQRGNKQQNAGVAAGGGQRGAASQEVGQLAQMMLVNFDQNGDAALNLIELRAALDVLLQRMRANRPAEQGDAAAAAGEGEGLVNEFRRGQANGQLDAAGQGRAAKMQGNRGGSGGGKGGRGH